MTRLWTAAAAGALLLAVSPAASAQYPPGGDAECLRVFNADGQADTTFVRGERFSATGNASGDRRCADPGEDVTLRINPVLDTVEADGDGDYAAIGLRIPTTIALGAATLAATTRLDGELITYTRAVTIVGAGPARLPATGRDIGILAGWGVAFVAAGTTLTLATRRRLLARGDGSVVEATDPPLLVDEDWERSWATGRVPNGEPAPVEEPSAPEPVGVEPRAPDRVADLVSQARRDLAQAEASRRERRHEWACFAAYQGGDKAVRGLHAALGSEVTGRSVARLLSELPQPAPGRLIDEGRVLDTYIDAARDPAVDADGVEFERYGDLQSEQAIEFARNVLGFVEVQLRR